MFNPLQSSACFFWGVFFGGGGLLSLRGKDDIKGEGEKEAGRDSE